MVQVGELVLFRIDEKVQRPLLVVSTVGEAVSGRLLLDWERDRKAWWVANVMKVVDPGGTVWIEGAAGGAEIGQWQQRKNGKAGG